MPLASRDHSSLRALVDVQKGQLSAHFKRDQTWNGSQGYQTKRLAFPMFMMFATTRTCFMGPNLWCDFPVTVFYIILELLWFRKYITCLGWTILDCDANHYGPSFQLNIFKVFSWVAIWYDFSYDLMELFRQSIQIFNF